MRKLKMSLLYLFVFHSQLSTISFGYVAENKIIAKI